MNSRSAQTRPIFTAVSGSVKQIYQLLRCVGFQPKAHVKITKEGLRVTVEDARVMQGTVFLDKAFFNTYSVAVPSTGRESLGGQVPSNYDNDDDDDDDDDASSIPPFQISLSSLLETLQIFGINESTFKDRWASRDDQPDFNFDRRNVLAVCGLCRLTYAAPGDPLLIDMEIAGVSTTCELTTFEPGDVEEIPLQKDAITQKIIMRALWLHDAIDELASTSPVRLTIMSSPRAPYFTLSSAGPLGSMTVEFSKQAELLETFQVRQRTANTYSYRMIKGASRAMALASKVSIRTDEQGVLSLQFMLEMEQEGRGQGISFVDFRFVPFAQRDDGDEEDEEEEV